jgi:hypothetical protein
MNQHPEARIARFQWVVLSIGLVLLVTGAYLSIGVSVWFGAPVSLGALGWFGLGLMSSPLVRKDLFGDRFELPNDAAGIQTEGAKESGCTD